jgi:hypothetical protein
MVRGSNAHNAGDGGARGHSGPQGRSMTQGPDPTEGFIVPGHPYSSGFIPHQQWHLEVGR